MNDDARLFALASQLIQQPSVTPTPMQCLDIIEDFCTALGWHSRRMDKGETANLFITTTTRKHHHLLFGGHVDVVPPGDASLWSLPPFSGEILDDKLYGRGAVDMKSSIAAFLIALQDHGVALSQNNAVSVAMIITSDEEGDAVDGTAYVIDTLVKEGYRFEKALVGEPTSEHAVGDTIKTGRRGSLSATLKIHGTQSHVAYASHAVNPLFALATFLQQAQSTTWDSGHADFLATAFCPTSALAGAGANNVTPSHVSCDFNFRFCPSSTPHTLKTQVITLLDQQALPYQLQWSRASLPFFKTPSVLCRATRELITQRFQQTCHFSTSGGTSDARFIATHVDEIMELGPLNATAHQIDEHIPLKDLSRLRLIYRAILAIVIENEQHN